MRCKKHPTDVSSGVGVCASCIRERLFAIIAAQSQAQVPKDCRKSGTELLPPPPPSFPRSVSPYISRRKSGAATCQPRGHHQLFHSTPQLGPTGSIPVEIKKGTRRSKAGRFSSLFFGLFRSKSGDPDLEPGPISDTGVPIDSSCTASSPSWFSTVFITRRRKTNIRTFSVDEPKNGAQRRVCKNPDRGMSPARQSDDEDHDGSSGYTSESSQGWRQTPRNTPAHVRRGGGKAATHSKSVSGLKFCMSPLVRASPNRHWNQKGMTPEIVVAGESRVPAKPYLSAAASFCKNRSRKLADFGRYNYDPTH